MDGPEAVEQVFYGKAPPLMEEGGYVPTVDDAIMPDISLESYKHFIDQALTFRFSKSQTDF